MKKYLIVTVADKQYQVTVEEVDSFDGVQPTTSAPAAVPAAPKAAPAALAAHKAAAPAGRVAIKAPMAGTIVKVNVTVGQSVKKGDVVAVLEAMKMENEIFASTDGTVASVNVSKGTSVAADDLIISMN